MWSCVVQSLYRKGKSWLTPLKTVLRPPKATTFVGLEVLQAEEAKVSSPCQRPYAKR